MLFRWNCFIGFLVHLTIGWLDISNRFTIPWRNETCPLTSAQKLCHRANSSRLGQSTGGGAKSTKTTWETLPSVIRTTFQNVIAGASIAVPIIHRRPFLTIVASGSRWPSRCASLGYSSSLPLALTVRKKREFAVSWPGKSRRAFSVQSSSCES